MCLEKKHVTISLIVCLCLICSGNLLAQRRWEANSDPFHLRTEDSQEVLRRLQEDYRRAQEQWAQELAAQRAALSEDSRVSDAIQMVAIPNVTFNRRVDGTPEMNLVVNFSYSTQPEQPGTVSIVSDDYPLGRYNPNHSNATRLMLDFARNKMETELVQYYAQGREITINITGETDGSPVLGRLPYYGDYGNFVNRPITLNGRPGQITVTSDEGITTNAQLGFLRAQGIEDFLRRDVGPLQATNNSYQTFVVENPGRGGQYRRISVEMIIHGAFNDRLSMLPDTDENDEFVSILHFDVPATGPIEQSFSNLRLQYHDGTLLVIYDLEKTTDIEMHVSFDNGETFRGPLRRVVGAVGRNVTPGKEKIIIWNVVEEVGYVDYPQTVIKLIGVEKEEPVTSRVYYKHIIGIEGGAGIPISRVDEPYDGYNFHFGARYTYNISPYFGVEVIKLKFEKGRAYWENDNSLNSDCERNLTTVQALAGLRATTPHFGVRNNITVFTALRAGMAFSSENGYYWTMGGRDQIRYYQNNELKRFRPAFEWDIGVQYKRVYLAASLNGFRVTDLLHRDWRQIFPFHGIKIGVDIARWMPVEY